MCLFRSFHPYPLFSVVRSLFNLPRPLCLLLTIPDRCPRVQPNQPSQPTKRDRKPRISVTSLPYPSASFTDHHLLYHLVFLPGGHDKDVCQVTDSPVVASALSTYFPLTNKEIVKIPAICGPSDLYATAERSQVG
jgi:hypothetical protein